MATSMSILEDTVPTKLNISDKRIMVVDDSLTVRKVVNKSLESAGIEITECASGKEGLNILKHTQYDLIFLDYILPDSTAAEFLDELLKNMHYAQVPVILMSSKGAEIERLSEFKQNVVATLTKPFANPVVRETVESIFGVGIDSPLDTKASPKQAGAQIKAPSQVRVLLEKGLSRVAGHIPALEAKRQATDPKKFYLPYLMHPDLVRSIEQIELQESDASTTKVLPDTSGGLDSSTIYELLSSLWIKRQTGSLELIGKGLAAEVFLHKGMVVGVSTKDAQAYLNSLNECGMQWNEDSCKELKASQEKSGKPFLLEASAISSDVDNAISLLQAASENLISKILSDDCSYNFWSGRSAPQWAIEYSLNQNAGEFFLKSLRRIHGWGIISREIGDLVTRFNHRFTNAHDWHLAYLTSFETVVCDFLKYEYSVAELASTLGEVPSRVAETIHTLHKFGLLAKAKQTDPETFREEICQPTNLLVISSNETLVQNVAQYTDKNELTLHHYENTNEALIAAKDKSFPLVITDGSCKDGHRFEAAQKLRFIDPELIIILAENPEVELQNQEAVQLHAFDFLADVSKASQVKKTIDAAIDEFQARGNTYSEDVDELESVNTRLTARQRQLDAMERELQKREHELLHNEEVFFEQCNRFEEERARLEILQENYTG